MDVITRQSLHHTFDLLSHTSPQDLLLVPVSARTVRSSTRMVHVCAELVSSSTMNWILKALPLTVDWTASLRSVKDTDAAVATSVAFISP